MRAGNTSYYYQSWSNIAYTFSQGSAAAGMGLGLCHEYLGVRLPRAASPGVRGAPPQVERRQLHRHRQRPHAQVPRGPGHEANLLQLRRTHVQNWTTVRTDKLSTLMFLSTQQKLDGPITKNTFDIFNKYFYVSQEFAIRSAVGGRV